MQAAPKYLLVYIVIILFSYLISFISYMHWLIDAQLPPELATWLIQHGEKAIHAHQLPFTKDRDLATWAARNDHIIISKDLDLIELHIRLEPPSKVLYLNTPNQSTNQLLHFFESFFGRVQPLFEQHSWVELTDTQFIVHW